MTATKTGSVRVPRDVAERFIVEVDALAMLETIRNGGHETGYEEHVYGIVEAFERVVFPGLREAEANERHARANERGRELARDMFGPFLEGGRYA